MKNSVSVVIPIFGEAHHERLPATIDSVLAQGHVDREVIVSEQGRVPCWEHLRDDPEVEYVFTQGEGNAGSARNEGLKRATREFTYFNDADVVFLERTYLRDLCATIGRGQVFTRVAMRRMLREEVPGFLDIYGSYGIEDAIEGLLFPGEYQATLSEHSPPLVPVDFDGRRFTATPAQLAAYRHDPDAVGKENLLWQRTVHCGMTFGRTEDFLSVGGYSPDYPVCTYEDSDFQWKLGRDKAVREIGSMARFRVMHLDHDLSYRSPELEARNKEIFRLRRERGADACIEEDVARF